MSEGYNGWKNYETWLVKLHITNDQGWDELIREMVEDGNFDYPHELGDYIKEQIEEMVDMEEINNPLLNDLINAAISEVDFREIAEHYIDEE